FDKEAIERELLARLQTAITKAGLWDELSTDWLLLDCELMPWSAKAQELLTKQYAPVGASATHATSAAIALLKAANVEGVQEILDRFEKRQDAATRYVDAYRRYCWPVESVDELKLAPFHILASENAVHIDKDHVWHMETLTHICSEDPNLLLATPY